MRKAILAEPKGTETDEDSEEEDGGEINQEPVERVIKVRRPPNTTLPTPNTIKERE